MTGRIGSQGGCQEKVEIGKYPSNGYVGRPVALPIQVVKQHDGVVAGAVTSGKQQSQRAMVGLFEELSNNIILVVEFLEIPRTEFTE